MTPLTPERIAELRALAEACTEPKWIAGKPRDDGGVQVYSPSRGVCRQIVLIAETDSEANAAFIASARQAVSELLDEVERLATFAAKVDAIRNSIIGFQSVSWSEHIYPLVAALGDAGYPGIGYDAARANVDTLIAELRALEAENARLQAEATLLDAQAERLWVALFKSTRTVARLDDEIPGRCISCSYDENGHDPYCEVRLARREPEPR
jgi:hypothetical protein